MTIASTSYTPTTYTGAGVGPYTFDFECLANSIFVLIDDELSPIAFDVTLNGDGPIYQGGSVVFDLPVASTSTITIGRTTPQDQQVDYPTRTRFPAEAHEFALDKLTLISQENAGSGGGPSPSPGAFLPLAGGTMDDDAAIGFGTAPTSGAARILMASILGVPAMVIQPTSGAPDMGIVLQADDAATKTLAVDVNGVWAITGRPEFSTLPGNALATKDDVETGGGQFLPLAGGALNDEADILWTTLDGGGSVVRQTVGGVLGVPSVVFQPDAGQNDIGYLFQIDAALTKSLAGSTDGTWALQGRPAYSGLAGTAIAIKDDVETRISRAGDTWDVGVTQVFPRDPAAVDSSALELSVINFFGITALRVQAATASTTNGIGYLFLTDQQNVATSFMVGSKLDGWRVRNQLFTDSDALVTVQYLADNTTGLPPNDPGVEYVQRDGAWVVNTGGSGGEANTNSNAGAGFGLVLPKVGDDTPIKSLVEGANITITEQADTITIAASGTVGVAWGSITGTLSTQTDLQAALDAKMDLAGGTWGADALQVFTRPAALPSYSNAEYSLTNVLGVATFSWAPENVGGTRELGFSFNTSLTGSNRSLGGSQAAGWQITGQLLTSANSIVTRGTGDTRYASVSHTHTIAQVTGLQTQLDSLQAQIDGKAPSSAVNTATWGSINGTLSNQSDLQFAFDAKASKDANESITGIYTFTAGFSASVGVVLSGGAICGGSRIQGVGSPVAGTDAATRAWVEANFVAI